VVEVRGQGRRTARVFLWIFLYYYFYWGLAFTTVAVDIATE